MNNIRVNDKVEIISRFNLDLYGKSGIVRDIKEGKHGIEVRVEFEDGYETWIDITDLSILLEK
ncbi:ATPase [Bacillus sp. NPDC077411]|uniref:ATPase n=1 Tax=Bacillus sp. NPDC077411 TaxID=3363947 RepID=UPI0037C50B61